MQLYPSYQLPPQVRALAGRQLPGVGPAPNDTYMHNPHGGYGANAMVQAPQQQGAPQPLTPAQQAAVSGAGPGIMPAQDAAQRQLQQQQFLAGASTGMDARGLRATPPPMGTPQYANLPPQVAALANSYDAPQVQGVQQPVNVQPVQQQIRPDLSNQAGFLGGYRRALVR